MLKERRESIEDLIYNYLEAEQRTTIEQTMDDLLKKYDISLTKEFVEEIFNSYVTGGVLSPILDYYIFIKK